MVPFAALRIRAGRTSKASVRKSSTRASSAASRRKASLDRDDDDDDNDGEDSDDREPPRKTKSKTASKQKGKSAPVKGRGKDGNRSKMEMVPWGSPARGGKGKPKTLGLREKLEDLAKHGQSAYKDVYRRAKVRHVVSSSLFYYEVCNKVTSL